MIEPAIVVIAFNREKPLKRLLKSLSNAQYPSENIKLHISIDGSSVSTIIEEVVNQFEWQHGEKIVDVKKENLGLLKHVLECGQLTNIYGSIIVLEDDLMVSPGFYNYAHKANAFYTDDSKIAGVSLYSYPCEESNFYPFYPIKDDSGVHFIQVASSWGQSWTKNQWADFKSWITEYPLGKESLLPDYILKWGSNSWKKLFINYLIDTDRYFVFPNISYSTNFEEEGTHASDTGLFQVRLNLGDSETRLKKFQDSNAIYDTYFELKSDCLKKLCESMKGYDFDVDLYGEKALESIDSGLVLTSRRGRNPIISFGAKMRPLLQNILFNIQGKEIGLFRKEDISLTEKNRYLLLESSSVRLQQYSEARNRSVEQVTLIMPVLEYQLDNFKVTLKGMKSDRFYNVTLLVVCSHVIEKIITELSSYSPLNIKIIPFHSDNIDEYLRVGITNCSTDFCSWMQPGMLLDLSVIEDVARVFQGMSQVQILQGLNQQVNQSNYSKLCTANYRWTPQRANSNKEEVSKIRTELIFWRSSLISADEISIMKIGSLFLELLKRNPIYILALKVGDLNDVKPLSTLSPEDVKNSLIAREFQPKGGVYTIIRPIFQYWFRRNVTFFRFFYKEMEQLPLVIRYDFKNDSFYLDNY